MTDYISREEYMKDYRKNSEEHEKLYGKLDKIDNKIDSNFKWLLGAILSSAGLIIGILTLIKYFG